MTETIFNLGVSKTKTPESYIVRMLEISNIQENDRVLVLLNHEFLSYIKDVSNIQLLFASDSEFRIGLVNTLYPELKTIFIKNINKIDESLINEKFDLIISSPPSRNRDLKILGKIYNLSSKICFVHPSHWVFDNTRSRQIFDKTRELVKSHFILSEPVSEHLAISFIDKSKVGINDEIYEIDVHGNSKIYKNLKRKILGYPEMLENRVTHDSLDGMYECGFAGIKGNSATTFLNLKQENQIGSSTKYWHKFQFEKLNETENFRRYLNLKIVRFCLSIFKHGMHFKLESTPYMPTYEHEWTDEMVAEKLGLTDEELKWAINWVPDFYPEDKEKYSKFKN